MPSRRREHPNEPVQGEYALRGQALAARAEASLTTNKYQIASPPSRPARKIMNPATRRGSFPVRFLLAKRFHANAAIFCTPTAAAFTDLSLRQL